MPKVEIKRTFHVPLEKALEYFGNHDLYNEAHERDDTICTVLSREGNEVLVEVKQEVGAQVAVYTTKTVYRLPHSVETETLSGIAKGTLLKLTFESVPDGTKVTYATDFKVHFIGAVGKAVGLVSGKMMKKMARQTMEEGAEVDRKNLEGDQPQPPAPE